MTDAYPFALEDLAFTVSRNEAEATVALTHRPTGKTASATHTSEARARAMAATRLARQFRGG